MKFKYFSAIATGLALMGTAACTPDSYELPAQTVSADDLIEGIAYSVTPDAENPNIIHCRALVPESYTVLWETPNGRSEDRDYTLELAFEGDYEVSFGVDTRAGLVMGEPYKFTITTFCGDFVTDKWWTMLTGGVGNTKTWIYDNGQYGFKEGELSYGDPSANPEIGFGKFEENWTPSPGAQYTDAAMWESTMTFGLSGGATYEFYNSTTGVTQTGKFQLNNKDMLLTFIDADMMHSVELHDNRVDWRRASQIIEMDENHLRIAYLRIPCRFGGEWYEVINYVSKDYADNYVPGGAGQEPTVELPAGWQAELTNEFRYATWILDEDVPFDWCGLDGKRLNTFAMASDYPAGYQPVSSQYEDFKLRFNLDTPGKYQAADVTGDYTLNADGTLSLSAGLPAVSIAGPIQLTTADGGLRVLNMVSDDLGRVKDLWLGVPEYDVTGKKIGYIGYHFLATYGGSNVKTYKAFVYYRDCDAWSFYGPLGNQNIAEGADGNYTFTATLPASGAPEISLDFENVLAKNPNFAVTVTSCKMNGKDVPISDATLDRKTSYDSFNDTDPAIATLHKNTARIAIVNPYNDADPLKGNADLAAGGTFEISVSVKFDGGSVTFVKPE